MASSSQNTSGNTQQQSQSTSNPWAPAAGTLQTILGQANTAIPTAYNQATASQPDVLNTARAFMGGDPSGLLGSGLSAYKGQLAPILGGDLDPTKNPLLANVLSTIRNDVGNTVNQQFAGAGRDLSGMNTQTLARGISQGEAPALLGQYNQNVQNLINAGSQLFGANYNTGNAISGNMAQGPGMIQQAIGMPLNTLGAGANLTVPIAGLGGQVQGSANTNTNLNTTYNPSLMTDIMNGLKIAQMGAGGFGGIMGGLG